jgi:hypothetical protein
MGLPLISQFIFFLTKNYNKVIFIYIYIYIYINKALTLLNLYEIGLDGSTEFILLNLTQVRLQANSLHGPGEITLI